MKLMHLSDLHLGKRVNEFNMLEEQAYILEQILQIADREAPDAVLIAGDIYDKTVPPAEAVQLFDRFLCSLAGRKLQVFVISGNHDSPERIAFGGRLMQQSGIHMSPVYSGAVAPITLQDAYGAVDIFMLPFVKPAHVRRFFPEAETETYNDALRTAVEQMPRDDTHRRVLITHQFVTGAQRSDSEEVSVGGTDHVDVTAFEGFDYVALGHIHKPQNIGSPAVRYSGTPLKYSFSEANQEKSVTMVELKEKGTLSVTTVPLTPRHDLREIRGTYEELTAKSTYEGTATEDYLHITLTDEEDIPEAVGRLRTIYPNLMKLDYDNRRTRSSVPLTDAGEVEKKSPFDLFSELYEKQNNAPMNEEQKQFSLRLMEEIWEDKA